MLGFVAFVRRFVVRHFGGRQGARQEKDCIYHLFIEMSTIPDRIGQHSTDHRPAEDEESGGRVGQGRVFVRGWLRSSSTEMSLFSKIVHRRESQSQTRQRRPQECGAASDVMCF
jgi:hypothetical protein